jgi:DNA-binding CsgD family transcriptional regulator
METQFALSVREREILKLIAQELTSAEIASITGLSIRTIETHRKHIIKKTNLKTTAALVKLAIREGMIEGYVFTNKKVKQKKTVD